jgi:3-deoxy-D-manno-octulosonate 8-phosphate phosphatase (KDO 8-P phosphatase)
MPSRARTRISPSEFARRAQRIRLLLVDVDGVLTDGRIYLVSMPDGTAQEMKVFHSQDGAALKLARIMGLRTGLVTGRDSAATTRRARELGMEFVWQGQMKKLSAYEQILREARLTDAEAAYMGDDLPDLPLLARAGLALAPANAVAEVKRLAHLVTRRRGGEAAVREAIEAILRARGVWREAIGKAEA